MASELSFGVELEGIFIFHLDLLTTVLKPGETVRRNGLTDQNVPLSSNLYPSGWAIRYKEGEQVRFTTYKNHAVEMAKSLIAPDHDAESEGSMDMSEGEEGEDMEQDNEADTNEQQPQHLGTDSDMLDSDITASATSTPWLVERDISITQFTKDEKNVRGWDTDMWDSSDIEFISKKYVYGNGVGVGTMQSDMQTLLNALTNNGRSDLDVKNDCGMHIHVGLNDNSRLPIKALRNLAFISLIFEPEISKVHEQHRAPGNWGSHFQSNLLPFALEWDANNGDWTHPPDYFTEESGAVWRSRYRSIKGIREAVFSTEHGDGDEGFAYLKKLLSPGDSKKWVVNFQNIDGSNVVLRRDSNNRPSNVRIERPPTVEFREFAATFDPAVAGHRVHFCGAIMLLAMQLAENNAEVFAEVMSWNEIPVLEDLLTKLDLPGGTRQYFQTLLQQKGTGGVEEQQDLFWELCQEHGDKFWEEDW
jgi:uncharacterized cupredoxin-like copper-binding protein